MRLNDGTVQVIVRDGKVLVVGLNLGGGDLAFSDHEDSEFAFNVSTLMAGMEYVLRKQGAQPESLDFGDDDDGGPAMPEPFVSPPRGPSENSEAIASRIAGIINKRRNESYEPFPQPPYGI